MNVVVTGASGFVGRHLIPELVSARHDVVALTRKDADLADPLFAGPPLPGADAVVFLAQSKAYRDFPAGARDMFAVNDAALLACLEWGRGHGVTRFVFASSANVYAPSGAPISEAAVPAPSNFYGQSKRIAEMLLESYGGSFDCVAVRLFTVYGPGQTGMLIPSLVDRVRRNQVVDVQGTSGLKLSPVYVGDVARCITAELARPATPGFEVVNVGGPEALGIRDMAVHIGEALGLEPRFRVVDGPEPGGYVADCTRLGRRLGWNPGVTFREGIRRTLAPTS